MYWSLNARLQLLIGVIRQTWSELAQALERELQQVWSGQECLEHVSQRFLASEYLNCLVRRVNLVGSKDEPEEAAQRCGLGQVVYYRGIFRPNFERYGFHLQQLL